MSILAAQAGALVLGRHDVETRSSLQVLTT